MSATVALVRVDNVSGFIRGGIVNLAGNYYRIRNVLRVGKGLMLEPIE